MGLDQGRTALKLRTRSALLAAARRLIARGEPLTVVAAAAEGGISKVTAYRYFTAPETLAMEAALDGEVLFVETVIGEAGEVRERVHRVHRHLLGLTRAKQRAFRLYLAKALGASVEAGREGASIPRAGRRVPMFEAALAPVQDRMAPDAFARLVHGLSAVIGIEAWIALKDMSRLADEEAEAVALGVVDALLASYLPR